MNTAMTLEEIQKRIDAMPSRMAAKGLCLCNADFTAPANQQIYVLLHFAFDPLALISKEYRFFRGDNAAVAMAGADMFIDSLPSIEEANRNAFAKALGHAIELGQKNGVDVTFVNPLVEAMKQLSENALTFVPDVSALEQIAAGGKQPNAGEGE